MPIEDTIKDALSNVDLSAVVDDIKKTQTEEGKTTNELSDDEVLAQFKSPKAVLKGYKDIQSAFTRVSQENKKLKGTEADNQKLKEEIELLRLSQQPQTYQPQYQPPQYQQQNAGEPNVAEQVRTGLIADTLEDLATREDGTEDPEFQERYAYAQMVSRRYPQLSKTSKGVRKLFQLGDKLKEETIKKNASRAIESFLGVPLTEETITKAKKLILGERGTQQSTSSNAYMPETSTSTKIGSESGQNPTHESRINESVKQGDVDGTIKNIFEKILAE